MQTTGTFPQLAAGQHQTVAVPSAKPPLKRKPQRPMTPAPSPMTAALQQLTANALRRG